MTLYCSLYGYEMKFYTNIMKRYISYYLIFLQGRIFAYEARKLKITDPDPNQSVQCFLVSML